MECGLLEWYCRWNWMEWYCRGNWIEWYCRWSMAWMVCDACLSPDCGCRVLSHRPRILQCVRHVCGHTLPLLLWVSPPSMPAWSSHWNIYCTHMAWHWNIYCTHKITWHTVHTWHDTNIHCAHIMTLYSNIYRTHKITFCREGVQVFKKSLWEG